MDELAKKLSFLSFGVIGAICLIGVLQQRSWLEMFTIGGKFFGYKNTPALLSEAILSSIVGGSCYPRRSSNRHHCHSSSRCFKNGKEESYREEIAFR
jgi:hypothetical protein